MPLIAACKRTAIVLLCVVAACWPALLCSTREDHDAEEALEAVDSFAPADGSAATSFIEASSEAPRKELGLPLELKSSSSVETFSDTNSSTEALLEIGTGASQNSTHYRVNGTSVELAHRHSNEVARRLSNDGFGTDSSTNARLESSNVAFARLLSYKVRSGAWRVGQFVSARLRSRGVNRCQQDTEGERVGCKQSCKCEWFEGCFPKDKQSSSAKEVKSTADVSIGVCGPSVSTMVLVSVAIIVLCLSCVVFLRVYCHWRRRTYHVEAKALSSLREVLKRRSELGASAESCAYENQHPSSGLLNKESQ